ncbi:MAG: hypothetical protein LBT40_15380 [Deltaproteobacteria bacterium]|nr:hypothetical protein [Deltaproteobacteria bacterium]
MERDESGLGCRAEQVTEELVQPLEGGGTAKEGGGAASERGIAGLGAGSKRRVAELRGGEAGFGTRRGWLRAE